MTTALHEPVPRAVVWSLARLLAGLETDRVDLLPNDMVFAEPLARVAAADGDGRFHAFDAWLSTREDGEEIRVKVMAIDPKGPPPAPPFSTWAEVKRTVGPIKWDWCPWLPRGMLVILASMSGEGKSIFALRLAACYLLGWPWPDGTEFEGETGCILWAEAEAAQALNLERAEAWGLPLDRILTPFGDPLADVSLDGPEHQAAITDVALRPEVRFVIVDSLSGGSRRDENSSEIMAVTRWLAELARDAKKPVLLTHHLRKRSLFDSDGISLDRLRGSSSIVQMARVIWALDTPDPSQKDTKRLSVIKNNLARFPQPIGVAISDTGVTFSDAPEPPKMETVTDRARDLLTHLLADEAKPSAWILEQFDQAGISRQAANRAKDKMHIVSVKPGGIWHW